MALPEPKPKPSAASLSIVWPDRFQRVPASTNPANLDRKTESMCIYSSLTRFRWSARQRLRPQRLQRRIRTFPLAPPSPPQTAVLRKCHPPGSENVPLQGTDSFTCAARNASNSAGGK